MDYTRIAEDMRFLDIMIKEEREMDSYINECIILSSGNMKAINEMQVLNESKFSDRISTFFTKIQAFFVRIFAKFGEKLSAMGKNNKEYLEKYKNIILGKKLKISYVTMINHFEGKKRIDEMRNDSNNFAKLPSNDFWDTMKTKVGDKKDSTSSKFTAYDVNDKEQLQKDLFVVFLKQVGLDSKIKYNKGDENIGGLLKEYFMGSSQEVQFSNSDLQKSMDVIYNALYSYEETYNNIEKFKTSYTTALNSIKSKYLSELNKIITENNSKNNDIDSKIPKTENTHYRYNTYFNEMEIKMDNSSSSSSGNGNKSNNSKIVTKKYDSGVSTPGSETAKQKESTMGNKKMTSYSKDNSEDIESKAKTVGDANSSDTVGITDDDGSQKTATYKQMSEKYDVDNYIQNCNDYFSAYQYIRTQTFAAMLTSIESMNSDYMNLIRNHVNSYLGQVNNDSDNTNTKYVNTSDTTKPTASVPV